MRAHAQESDWIADESLRLTDQVKTLAGSPAWRALMGGSAEIAELLDGFAASDQAQEAARYTVTGAQADNLLARKLRSCRKSCFPWPGSESSAASASGWAVPWEPAHIAAQSIAMAGESLPLPEGWEGDNQLVLLACGETWSALVTMMDTGTGVLAQQATFLHMTAADAMAGLEEMGLQPQ